jgi:mannan endo-1,4-beta-mannosidase
MLKFFIFLWFLLCSIQAFSDQVVYNGGTTKFSTSSPWDQNGSTLVQKKDSTGTYLLAKIYVKNYWGAVAYVPNNWQSIDISKFKSMSIKLKASAATSIKIGLYDSSKQSIYSSDAKITTKYTTISIPLPPSGINLTTIQAIIFALQTKGNYIVDITNITLVSGTPVPTPIPTPVPTPIPTPSPSPTPSPIPTPIPPTPIPTPTPQYSTMKTNGRFLYDACGQKVILRGFNQMTCWTDWVGTARDGLPMFSEMAKTGANTVRIVWTATENTTTAQLEAAITNAEKNGLIPIIENHDQTCNWSDAALNSVLAFWTQPDMVAMIQRHQKDLLLNFANEMGEWGTTPAQYIAGYSRVVKALRTAGIHVPIILDSSKCGQDEVMIPQVGQQLIQADPDHNIIISLHIYWTDQNAARIANAITSVNALDIPMIIGEFSVVSVDCSTPVLWQEIIKQAQLNQIGYLPWSWDHQNSCPAMSMTKDANMSYSTLWGWALQLAVTDPNSIKNTSIRSQCLTNTAQLAIPKKYTGKLFSKSLLQHKFNPKTDGLNGVKIRK